MMRRADMVLALLALAGCFHQERAWELFDDPAVSAVFRDPALGSVLARPCVFSPEVGERAIDLTGTWVSTACRIRGVTTPEVDCARSMTIDRRAGERVIGTGDWFDGADEVVASGPAVVRAEIANMTDLNATLWVPARRDLGVCTVDVLDIVYVQEGQGEWTFCALTVVRDAAACGGERWQLASGSFARQ